jgi:hypothetical protein
MNSASDKEATEQVTSFMNSASDKEATGQVTSFMNSASEIRFHFFNSASGKEATEKFEVESFLNSVARSCL